MIELKENYSDTYEIVLFKRDSLGNIKENEPKEHYSTNDPQKLFNFWDRRAGFAERRREMTEAKERRRKEKKSRPILTRADTESKKVGIEDNVDSVDGRSVIAQQKAESSG